MRLILIEQAWGTIREPQTRKIHSRQGKFCAGLLSGTNENMNKYSLLRMIKNAELKRTRVWRRRLKQTGQCITGLANQTPVLHHPISITREWYHLRSQSTCMWSMLQVPLGHARAVFAYSPPLQPPVQTGRHR